TLLALPWVLGLAAWVGAQGVSVINDAYSFEDNFNDNVGIDGSGSTGWQNNGGLIQANAQNFRLQSTCFSLPQPVGSTFDGWLFGDLSLSQTGNLSSHRLEVQDCAGNVLVTQTSPIAGGASVDLRSIPASTTSIRLAYIATHSATPNGSTVLPVRVDFWRVFGQATGPTQLTVTQSATSILPNNGNTITLSYSSTGATTRNAVLVVPMSEVNGWNAANAVSAPDDGLATDAEVDYGNGDGLRAWREITVSSANATTGSVSPVHSNPGGPVDAALTNTRTGDIQWNLGTIGSGSSGSATLVVRARQGMALGSTYAMRARIRHGATPLQAIAGLSATQSVTSTAPTVTVNGLHGVSLQTYAPYTGLGPGAQDIDTYAGPLNTQNAGPNAVDLVGVRVTVTFDSGTCTPLFDRWQRGGPLSTITYPHRVISAPTAGQPATTPLVVEFDRLPFNADFQVVRSFFDVPTTCTDGQEVRLTYRLQVASPVVDSSGVRTFAVATNACHSAGNGGFLHRNSQATATGSSWQGAAWPGQPEFYEIFASNGHTRAGEYFTSWSPYAQESARTHTLTLDRTYAVLTVQPGVTFHGLNTRGFATRVYKDSTGTAALPGAAGFSPLADPPHSAWQRVTINPVRPTQTATAGQISHDPTVTGDAHITPFSAAPNDANPSAVVAPGTRLMIVKWNDNPAWQGPDFGNFAPQALWRMADGSYGVAEPAEGTQVSVNTGLQQWSYKQGVSPGDVPQSCGAAFGATGTTRKGAVSMPRIVALNPQSGAIQAGQTVNLLYYPANLNSASARTQGSYVVNLFNLRNQLDLSAVTGGFVTSGLNVPAGGNLANIVFTPPNPAACAAALTADNPACMAVWAVPADTQLPNGWGNRAGSTDDYTNAYRFSLNVPILRTVAAGTVLNFVPEIRRTDLSAR
ncbi:MAG: hypothetical protein RJA10_1519, partial [Pseudomonadota bacterium]